MTPRRACRHVADDLPAFLSGTLDPGEAERVRRHVADCPACAAKLAAWYQIRSAALADPAPLPSPAVLTGVLAKIEQAGERRPRSLRLAPSGPVRWRSVVRGKGGGGGPGRLWPAVELSTLVLVIALLVGSYLVGYDALPFVPDRRQSGVPSAGAATQPLAADLPAVVAREPAFASLTLLSLQPGESVTSDGFQGSVILSVWLGDPIVRSDTAATFAHAPREGATPMLRPVAAGETIGLVAGDDVAFTADAGYQIRNDGDALAEVIMVRLLGPGPPSRVAETPPLPMAQERLHVPAGPVTVSLTRYALPPGGVLHLGGAGHSLVEWVVDGSTEIVQVSATASPTAADAAAVAERSPETLAAGETVTVELGETLEATNPGRTAAVIVELTVAPIAADQPALPGAGSPAAKPPIAAPVARRENRTPPGGAAEAGAGPFRPLAAPGAEPAERRSGPPPWAGPPDRRGEPDPGRPRPTREPPTRFGAGA